PPHRPPPPPPAALLPAPWLARRFGGARDASPGAHAGRRELLVLGALGALLALAWVPPLIEQVTDHPGNLTLLYRFLRHPHGGFDGTGFPPTIVPASQDLSQ